MEKISFIIILLLLKSSMLFPQIAINEDGSAPDASAVLDVSYSNKGILIPRITTIQRNAISFPAEGLLIFNLTTGCFDYYLGGSWKSFCGVSEPVFQCGMKIADARDGRMYNTVKIGTQCWMAENLSASNYLNGDTIPNVTDVTTWLNLTTGAYCWYTNDSATYENTYGKLYNWFAINDSRGLCPTGWHTPTVAEWTTLTDYLGGDTIAGGKLKEIGTTHWISPNLGATNETGFSSRCIKD